MLIERKFERLPIHLTDRQLKVLTLVSRGERLKAIAHDLGLSESTVKAHLKAARLTVAAETIPHAVAIAISQGFIEPACFKTAK